jgi:hypothetical protein
MDIVPSMVVLCWSSHVCHKHEVPWGCLCITNLLAYWRHPKHIHLQMHMANIWHPQPCNQSQAMNTHSPFATCSLLTYNVNGTSLYNKSFGNWTIFMWYFPSSWLGKYMRFVFFVIPCNHGVVIPIVIIIKCDVWFNLVSSHAFTLITWHGWLCLTHKDGHQAMGSFPFSFQSPPNFGPPLS